MCSKGEFKKDMILSSYYYYMPRIVLSSLGSNEKLCTIRSVAGVHSVLSVYGDTVVVSALLYLIFRTTLADKT